MSSYKGSGSRGGPALRGGPPIRHGGSQQRKDAPYQPGPLEVIVNCFHVTQLPQRKYFHYDVLITPPLNNRARSIEIVDRLQNHVAPDVFQPRAIHDGRANLFSSHQLALSNGNSGSYDIGKYNVKLALSAGQTIDFSALHGLLTGRESASSRSDMATNVLQLLIRAAPNLMQASDGREVHNVRGARAYYTDVGKRPIGGGLELWQGLFQSARPSLGRMLINVDTSIATMYRSGHLPTVAMELLNVNNARHLCLNEDDLNFRKLKAFLKRLFVRVKPNGRKKQIRDLMPRAGEFEFNKETGQTTVENHFKEAYNIRLQFPKMFGIVCGSKERIVVYPAELCFVEAGQFYRKKVPSALTSKVVEFATKSPEQRLHTITSGIGLGQGALGAPALEYQTSPFIQDARMVVSPTPLTITGRVLQPPQLAFKVSSENPQHGKWNFVGKQFLKPVLLTRWAVVDYLHDERVKQNFVRQLVLCFTALGMKSDDPLMCNGNGHNIKKDLFSLPNKPTFILFILPQNAEDLRRVVKHTCDTELGILNQCVREGKVRAPSNQYLNNVAMKINARLGGENSIPRSTPMSLLSEKRFLIVGADTGHPGAGIRNQPSVTSLVWSYDQNAIKYKAIMCVQEPRTEIINDMYAMMKLAIRDNARVTKGAPYRIIFYRDGVSEGEFETVKREEIKAVQAAIDTCYQEWIQQKLITEAVPKPKLTFVVVGKRHHIRFFPKDGRGADRTGNCPAGFMAEEGIQSPIARDFYLQSHGGLLGTSRPGHYTVLRDDNFETRPALLQELSFALCHCYASATRSVSIPAPVYYADKVCARAKFHYDQLQGSDNDSLVSDDSPFDLAAWQDRFKGLHGNLINTMYFL